VGSGKAIRQMEKVITIILMGHNTTGNGSMISSMELGFKNEMMGQLTKGNFLMGKSMVKENFYGKITHFIKANSNKIIFKDSENIFGMTVEHL